MERGDRCYYDTGISYSHGELVKEWLPKAIWEWVPNFLVAKKTYPQVLIEDPFIRSVMDKFPGTYLNFYKVPGNSTYNWHRDSKCKVCINLVLDVYDSVTLFSHTMPYWPLTEIDYVWPLKYKPNNWYIFDTQERHMVVNYADTDRVLMTVRIPPPIQYKEVLEWYKTQM